MRQSGCSLSCRRCKKKNAEYNIWLTNLITGYLLRRQTSLFSADQTFVPHSRGRGKEKGEEPF
eukprot:scaffold24242_cov102-Skeletonema_dohrnii-CCMP3373.AAC.1